MLKHKNYHFTLSPTPKCQKWDRVKDQKFSTDKMTELAHSSILELRTSFQQTKNSCQMVFQYIENQGRDMKKNQV